MNDSTQTTTRWLGLETQGLQLAIELRQVGKVFHGDNFHTLPDPTNALGVVVHEGGPVILMSTDELLLTAAGTPPEARVAGVVDTSTWVVVLRASGEATLGLAVDRTSGPFTAEIQDDGLVHFGGKQWTVVHCAPATELH